MEPKMIAYPSHRAVKGPSRFQAFPSSLNLSSPTREENAPSLEPNSSAGRECQLLPMSPISGGACYQSMTFQPSVPLITMRMMTSGSPFLCPVPAFQDSQGGGSEEAQDKGAEDNRKGTEPPLLWGLHRLCL